MPNRRWTPEEKQLAIAMRTRGASYQAISALIEGTTPDMCQSMVANIRAGSAGSGSKPLQPLFSEPLRKKVSDEQLADRDAREALRLDRTDLTAAFFGDPLPGCSELDKRVGVQPPAGRRSWQAPSHLVPEPTLYWGKLKPDQVSQ